MSPCVQVADANPRGQASAQEAFEAMARTPQMALGAQMHLLLKPLKNQAAWKPVLARLKLLGGLLPIMDLAGPGSRYALVHPGPPSQLQQQLALGALVCWLLVQASQACRCQMVPDPGAGP